MVVPKQKKMEPKVQELYTSEVNLKELIKIEKSVLEELCSLETLKVLTAGIVHVIKDSAKKARAQHVKKSEVKTKFWFDRECQEQRTIYRRKRRRLYEKIMTKSINQVSRFIEVFLSVRNS